MGLSPTVFRSCHKHREGRLGDELEKMDYRSRDSRLGGCGITSELMLRKAPEEAALARQSYSVVTAKI